MSQVNVNTPGGGPEPVESGSGYGFIVGILVAIVVIVLLAYFLLLNPGSSNNATNNGGGGNSGGQPTVTPGPSAWHLVDLA
jgi:hypothetical protein